RRARAVRVASAPQPLCARDTGPAVVASRRLQRTLVVFSHGVLLLRSDWLVLLGRLGLELPGSPPRTPAAVAAGIRTGFATAPGRCLRRSHPDVVLAHPSAIAQPLPSDDRVVRYCGA